MSAPPRKAVVVESYPPGLCKGCGAERHLAENIPPCPNCSSTELVDEHGDPVKFLVDGTPVRKPRKEKA